MNKPSECFPAQMQCAYIWVAVFQPWEILSLKFPVKFLCSQVISYENHLFTVKVRYLVGLSKCLETSIHQVVVQSGLVSSCIKYRMQPLWLRDSALEGEDVTWARAKAVKAKERNGRQWKGQEVFDTLAQD